MIGASFSLILRHLFYLYEQRSIFVSMVSSYIPVIVNFKNHLTTALDKKKEWYKEVGLSDEECDKQTMQEQQFIEAWELIATTIFVASLPKKFQKYIATEMGKEKGER